MSFTIHTKETAPAISNSILEGFEQHMGFVPNLLGVMAESPFALQSVATVNRLLESSQLDPLEQRIVTVVACLKNECNYCVPAQSTIAKMNGMPDELLNALRNGAELADAKHTALRQFTSTVINNKGWVANSDVDAFLESGYKPAHVLEVVTLISLMMLTNYVSHIVNQPLDEAFLAQQWTSDKSLLKQQNIA